MTTVSGWTGREAALLRKALRLSVRDFAAHLGVGTRTVNKWEARQSGITPLPYMQAVLDTALAQASDEVKARFAAVPRAPVAETGGAGPSVLGTSGVLLPVVVGGHLVFVPVEAGTVGGSGLGTLLDDLAAHGCLGSSHGPPQAFGATVGTAGVAVWKVASWVDRRDFGQHVAGLVLGIAGAAGLDTDRLLALLPCFEPTDTRHLGAADVAAIEQLTTAFRSQDFAHGSGPVRDAAVSQLRVVLPLLDAQIPAELRPRLMLAAADLATQAGWMSFDILHHDAAWRLWMIALNVARNTDHPLSTDLTAYLLSLMTLQAVHLHRPEEALHLSRVAETATAGPHPVSASTTTLLSCIQAQAHAAHADATACDRALGEATERFSTIDPASAPPWTAYLAEVGITGGQGAAHYELALADHDSRAAGRAVAVLRQAVDHYGPGYAALKGHYLPDLAGAHVLAGDLGTAVDVGHQAVDAITALSSPLAHDRLRTLDAVLQPLHTSPGVADLRERLTATAA